MAKNFVRIDGWPVAPAVARDYVKLRDAHNAAFPNEPLIINSGYRTRSEQAAIFTSRYTRGGYSPYGDYRSYQGATWGRHSGLGPVASPDVGSNHTRGYALDLNLPQAGSARHNWFLANAARFNFNWVEGRSIGEWWHVCWKVGIFPNASTPDPWEGRGAPDPVHASDEGISVGGNSGGGGGSANDYDDLENDMSAKDDLEFLVKQVGGSRSRKTSLREDVDKLMRQVGGSDSRKTSLREDVDELQRAVTEIRQVLGSTVARAQKGDTLGVRLDKIIKHLSGKKPL